MRFLSIPPLNSRTPRHVLALGLLLASGCTAYRPMPLTKQAIEVALRPATESSISVEASKIRHPLLSPVAIDLRNGLSPESAAVLAVIVNPSLRVERDRRSLSSAQLLQAGLLPNPTLDLSVDPVTGGNTPQTVTGFSVGLSWELTSLISHDAKIAAAKATSRSVQLDVAWQEWQFAQAAKKAVYDLVALNAQLQEAAEVDRRLAENLDLIGRAVEAHQRTVLDSAAAEAASQKAHADFLSAQGDLRHQQLLLNEALGLPPDATVRIADAVALPSRLDLPAQDDLIAGIDTRRLDLLGLRYGYVSQEQTLRAAVLEQFPKITLGFHQASDTTNVHTTGFGVSVDLPVFDRNQGNIAIQKATRQQLFDEYVSRLFEARSAVAQSLDDIRSLTDQIAAAESAIPSLERLVKTYQLAIDQHNADILSFYSAQNDLAQKRIDLLKLKAQLLDNKIALEIAAGRYLPEPPATAPSTRQASAEAH